MRIWSVGAERQFRPSRPYPLPLFVAISNLSDGFHKRIGAVYTVGVDAHIDPRADVGIRPYKEMIVSKYSVHLYLYTVSRDEYYIGEYE